MTDVLTAEQIVDSFKDALGSDFVDSRVYRHEVAAKKNVYTSIWIETKRESLHQAVEHLSKLEEYPHLAVISSSDQGDRVELIYHFTIYYGQQLREMSLGLRVRVSKDDLKVATITDLIPGAIFPERETQEMMGVEVTGIPDGRRLFLSDDFPVGVYPWRKDETGPDELLRVLPGRQQQWQ